MKVYRVQAEEDGTPLYCKMWIDVLEYIGDVGESPMLISIVEMTEEEYNSLPEFSGF